MMNPIKLEITCPFCHESHYVIVEENDYYAYSLGELAQNAFPYLSATEREQIISRMCPECQKVFFGE